MTLMVIIQFRKWISMNRVVEVQASPLGYSRCFSRDEQMTKFELDDGRWQMYNKIRTFNLMIVRSS